MAKRTATAMRKPVADLDEMYPVETGFTIAPMTREKKYDFGFDKMKIGQSKFVPIQEPRQEHSLRQTLLRYTNYVTEATNGEAFFVLRKALLNPTAPEGKANPLGFRIHRAQA